MFRSLLLALIMLIGTSALAQGTFPNTVTLSGGSPLVLVAGTHGNRTVLLDCTGGDTVTVPAAADTDFMYFLKRTNTTGDCTIDPNASETIDGAITYVLSVQYEFLWIVTDGSNWHAIDISDIDVTGIANHEVTFTTQTSVTVTGATHGFAHRKITAQCYDDSSPKKTIGFSDFTVDSTTFDAVITFIVAQTGSCVLTGFGGTANHNILSTIHLDTTVAAVSRGSTIVGIGATPKWEEQVLGGAGTYHRSDGTDLLFASIPAGDIQELIGISDLTDYASKSGTGTAAIGATFTALANLDIAQWNGSNWVNVANVSLLGASIGASEVDADVATQAEIDLKANLAGPTFTGVVTVPAEAYTPAGWDGDPASVDRDSIRDEMELRPDAGSCTNQVVTATNSAAVPTCEDVDSAKLATANKTFYKSISLLDPTTAEDDLVQWMHGAAVTYTAVDCSTDQGTVTIDMDHRVITTPNTVGTDILTGTIICDTDNQADGGFADATIPANVPVNLSITAISGAPVVVRIHIRGTID